jgi:hypothetical protein
LIGKAREKKTRNGTAETAMAGARGVEKEHVMGGVRFLGEPYRYPWGFAAILLDQDGSPILLLQEPHEH